MAWVVALQVGQGLPQHTANQRLDRRCGLHGQKVAFAVVTVTEPLAFNPFDPGFRVDPYPTYRRLLAEDPVHRTPFGMLVLSRYRDCAAVLRDPRSSSDASNSNMYKAFMAGRDPEEVFGALAGMRPFLFMDPPDHTRLRALVQKAFTPRTVENLRPRIQELVDELMAPVLEQGSTEIIEDLAYPLPVRVITELLGVPHEDHETFKGWSKELAGALDPDFATPHDVAQRRERAASAFVDYFQALIAQRRQSPRDDLLTALVWAEDEGHKLSEKELLSTLILLLVAGHETTVNLIANGVLALCRHPDQLARLRQDPVLARSAVEEVLRFDPPVQFTARVALEDIDIDGTTLARGDQAIVLVAAANRDPKQFEQPDAFDVGRQDNRHLAFGLGAHFCLGAPLARVEGQVALEAVATRLDELALATRQLEYKTNIVLRGLASLPVTFRARR
ncbi:MAG: cytochrome P450 [Acidimicrobiia bacterium]|nr:cytochrome P450 [Acidimicrobiia bacterium]